MKLLSAIGVLVGLALLANAIGCGGSNASTALTNEDKDRQIKELKEQNVSEWGSSGKKRK